MVKMSSKKKPAAAKSKQTEQQKGQQKQSEHSITANTILKNPRSREATPNPEQNSSSSGAIIAYVQKLSPLKRNKKDTSDYSTLTLQTERERKDAVLYSRIKRPLLAKSTESHTPVKIQWYTFTSDGAKVIINDMTMVRTPNQTLKNQVRQKSPHPLPT